jgi:Arc/MetJ-type ribon-helix-helix transcriptional regulator
MSGHICGECVKLEPVKITIRLPLEFIDQIDFLVDLDDFPNRSEAIRTAIRDMLYQRVPLVLEKEEKKAELRKQMGKITEFRKEYMKQ